MLNLPLAEPVEASTLRQAQGAVIKNINNHENLRCANKADQRRHAKQH